MKTSSFISVFFSIIFIQLAGCVSTTHLKTGKQIYLMEAVSEPLILSKYGAGVYEQFGKRDDYELYMPVLAEVSNYIASNNRYLAVKNIGLSSEVCIPDSMNLLWCSIVPTKQIK